MYGCIKTKIFRYLCTETIIEAMNPALRFFNTTGPCNPDDHYMLPPEDRLVGAQLHRYINHKLYWVLHAPRQTGKTTFLQSWMRKINASGQAIACYVSVEDCQKIPEWENGMKVIYKSICDYAFWGGVPIPLVEDEGPEGLLRRTLKKWAELVAPKPLIVLFDEVDVLEGDAMISFLRQLRGGFASRGIGIFPVSVALVGMRDLKDYITASKESVTPNPGSPFNIKEDSAVMSCFTREDIEHLFAQRTAENGQQITQEALDYVYEQSKGQPWIVNSLFKRATLRILNQDSVNSVEFEHIKEAREQMILARETHLDALAIRLKDPGIRTVIQAILTGDSDPGLAESEAFRICIDLGLVAIDDGAPVIANPIYREVIARHLTYSQQLAIPKPEWEWERADQSLDMDRMLREFQSFWRLHADLWEPKSDYTEAFPHLLLMAFLQRVLNGGGHIDREYAAGRGRMDLTIEYKGTRYIIEIKLLRSYQTPEAVLQQGLKQIRTYRDKINPATPAYLIIFDRRLQTKEKSWGERILWGYDDDVAVLWC